MEPIRYLQPATFPPPASDYSEDKSVLRKTKHQLNNDDCSNSSICISGKCYGHNTHTFQIFRKQQSHRQQSHRFNRNYYTSLLYLAFVIFMCCNQALDASPVFVDNPSLAQFQSGRNIRHLPCIVRKSGSSGVCMFAIDCLKQNGTHLGTCIDRFYFGSCCQLKDENSHFAPEISDNSIDQNTILHFAPEATTLPTSALYKTTTESTHMQQPGTQIKSNQTSTTSTATITTHRTKPTKVTTSSAQQTKRPVGNSNTTHKISHFVVRTTKRPATTAKITTPKATTTTTQPITTKPRSTRKPSRPKTTTTAAPILTTDGPKVSDLAYDEPLQTTTSPPKLFTFQMVETTTPTQTESTDFIEFTTMQPPTIGTKRPHIPQTPPPTADEHKIAEVINIITSIQTSTTKPKPSQQPIRHTSKPKPATTTKLPATTTAAATTSTPSQTIQTTQKTRKPAPTIKTTTKRPKPSTKPASEQPKPAPIETSTLKPVPLADEIPPTIITHQKPITTLPSYLLTTHPQATRPKPIPSVINVSGSTIITTTIMNHNKPTSETISTTKKPITKPNPTTTTAAPKTTTTTTSTTPLPTKATPAATTTTTFKPGLITWTSESAEPVTNVTSTSEQQTAQWLPVSTIAPETSPNNKHEAISAAPPITSSINTPKTTTSQPIIIGSTEKIIVSVSSSVSEAEKNETRQPVRPPISTTPSPSTSTSPPPSSATSPPPSSATSPPPSPAQPKPTQASTPKLPTAPSKTSSNLTTVAPIDAEATTLDYEGFSESSTDSSWNSATNSSMIEGLTEDYNATGTATATTLPPTPVNSLEGVDYRQICGRRMFPEPRIVGGSNAAFGRWPWQISLRQWRTSTYLHKCGAALLNENWAITAAHCVDNVPPSDLLLRLGEYDLAEEEEPYGYQERRVQIVASHPQFDPRTFEYDLALLRFYEPVTFQPNIIPVCVPNSDENFIGQTAFVTGWGRLYEDGPLPSVLQEVAVPVINNTICETMYRVAGYIEHIPHIFICAGWKKGGYDSCEGDSGGPMVLQREDDKRFQLGGVISWGIGCAEANQPGVYTRISEFRDWINQILQF